ncbi:MAG: hypothetical protein M1818_003332 [Claussenomyces sp. TS43310]|nr:MAG: hypothetical protein M1818_003332 [Claussenomyces sp. TS43310]
MDLAYDHIQESALSPEESAQNEHRKSPDPAASTLNNDFQEAYKAISSSPWGAKLGGFFGSVVKQGENVYKEAQQELTAVGKEATKGLTDLQSSIMSRTRSLSQAHPQRSNEGSNAERTAGEGEGGSDSTADDRGLQDSDGMLTRLQIEAAKRLKEIQKAEDAADEALLKFGTNIRNFLRDAVSIAPPSNDEQSSTVLFESKDAQGKRVIHTTRFDAQLHVIHSSLDSFTKDPASDEYAPWSKTFNVESQTAHISKDLEKYEELRWAMEKLVPDKVAYADFWKRYYFLRHSIETAEARRRDLLKGKSMRIHIVRTHDSYVSGAAAEDEEEVGWGEDSDDEGPSKSPLKSIIENGRPASVDSSITIQPPASKVSDQTYLKPSEPRKSHDEKSQADSDASYDVVGAASGAPSHAPNSPKESKKADESEEEDWE